MSVESLISSAQGYAATVTSSAGSAMNDAKSAIGQISTPIFTFDPISLPYYAAPAPIAPFGGLPDVVFEPGTAPAIVTLQGINSVSPGAAPTLSATQLPFISPIKPSQIGAFNLIVPSINTNILFPEPPSSLDDIILSPSVVTRDAPENPGFVMPVFTGIMPTDNTVAPDDLPQQFQSAYSNAGPAVIAMIDGYVDAMLAKYNPRYHQQMEAIEAQLSNYMAGGTGLKPVVENAIYERSRSKQNAEARRVRDAALNDMASRGFTLPTGAMMSAIQQARQAAANNNAAAAREIVVIQAEYEQKNLQFAVTTSVGLRTTLLNASLSYMQNLVSINGQAIEFAKAVVSTVVEAYGIAQRIFASKLDAYKTEASIYETQLKGAMAGVELYKAEIDAFTALTNADRQVIEVYKARLEAQKTLADVYQSRINAIVSRANLERLKIDIFQAQVQAYAATVGAKNAEWQGYNAELQGEVAKAGLYKAEVDAYQARVQGYKAAIDAQVATLQAQLAQNTAITQQNVAAQETYRTTIQTKGEIARTKIANGQLLVQAYEANARASASQAASYAEYYKAVASTNIEVSRSGIQAVISSTQVSQASARAIAQVASSNASTYGQLASSAMAGMTTLAAELKNE